MIRIITATLLVLHGCHIQAAVVLLYHHVSESTPYITSISPAQFEAHLDHLVDNDFNVIPLHDMVARIRADESLPDKSIAISFDDAYISIYKQAYPRLKQRGLPFTIFVATDLVNTDSRHYLSWDQLREMSANGATIANHTKAHPHLLRRLPNESRRAWRRRVRSEILDVQEQLQQELGYVLPLFAYPYGEYSDELHTLVSKLDLIGFGQQSGAIGIDSMATALPRFPLAGDYTDMESFRTKVMTLPLSIRVMSEDPLLRRDELRPVLAIRFTNGGPPPAKITCYGPGGELTQSIDSHNVMHFSPIADLPVGRSRYNCTMPSASGERFHWYSHPWIRKRDDGSWPPEP